MAFGPIILLSLKDTPTNTSYSWGISVPISHDDKMNEQQIHVNQKPLRLSCLQNMISVFCRFERHLFVLRGLATVVNRGEHARMVVKKFMKPRSPSLYLQNMRNGDSAGKLYPYQFLDIDYTSIIDCPKERLSDHGFYSNNLKSVLSKVLKNAHKLPLESRFKALGGVTAGMGKGKTTSLEHIRSHLNKVPSTLAICVTFNNRTSPFDFIEYWNALRKKNMDSFARARLVYALSIMARLSSSFHNISFNTVTQEFLGVVSANVNDIVKCDPSVLLAVYVEALAQKLSEVYISEKPIDTVVVLQDESRTAAMEIRMLMGDDRSQHFDVTHVLREAMLEHLGGAELHSTSENPSNRVTGTVIISSLHIKELGKDTSRRMIVPVSMAEAIPAWFILRRWWLAGVWEVACNNLCHSDVKRLFLLAELLSDVPRQVEIFDECVAKEMRKEILRMKDVSCLDSLLPVDWLSALTEEVLLRYEDSAMPSPPLMEKIVFRGEVPLTSEVLTLIATSFLSTVPHSFCSEHDDLPTTIVPEMSLFLSYLYAKKAIEKDLDVSLAMHAYVDMMQGVVDSLQGKSNPEMGRPLFSNEGKYGNLLEYCTHHTLKIRLEAARGAGMKTLSLGKLLGIDSVLGTDSNMFPLCGLGVDLREPVSYSDMSGHQQCDHQQGDEKTTKLNTPWDSLYHQLNAPELSPDNPTIVVRCHEVPYFDEMLALLVNGEIHIVLLKCDNTGKLVHDGFHEMDNFFSTCVGCALQESSVERLSNVAQAFREGRNIHFVYLTTFPTVSASQSVVKCKTAAGEGIVLTESVAQKFFGKSVYRFLCSARDLGGNAPDDSGGSDAKSFILRKIEKEHSTFKEEQFSPEQYALWEKKE